MRKLVARVGAVLPMVALLAALVGCVSPGPAAVGQIGALSGPWQATNGSEYLNFAGGHMISYDPKGLVVRGIVRQEAGKLSLRHSGRLETWQASIDRDTLHLTHAGDS